MLDTILQSSLVFLLELLNLYWYSMSFLIFWELLFLFKLSFHFFSEWCCCKFISVRFLLYLFFPAVNVSNENRQKAKMNQLVWVSFFQQWPSTIQIFFSQACFIQAAAAVVPRCVSWNSFNRTSSKTSSFNSMMSLLWLRQSHSKYQIVMFFSDGPFPASFFYFCLFYF